MIIHTTKLLTKVLVNVGIAIVGIQAIAILIALALPWVINQDSTLLFMGGSLAVVLLFLLACFVLYTAASRLINQVSSNLTTSKGENHE